MGERFVPKKTITVQMTLEVWQCFERLCAVFGLTKTKTFEKMIDIAIGQIGGNENEPEAKI